MANPQPNKLIISYDKSGTDPKTAKTFFGASRLRHVNPKLRPEILHFQDQLINEISEVVQQLASKCGARIDVLYMRVTERRPPEGVLYERIELDFEEENGSAIKQTWFVPFIVRDATFSYDPRDVERVETYRPQRLPETLSPTKQPKPSSPNDQSNRGAQKKHGHREPDA